MYLNLVLAEALFSLVGCSLRGPGKFDILNLIDQSVYTIACCDARDQKLKQSGINNRCPHTLNNDIVWMIIPFPFLSFDLSTKTLDR